MEMMTLLAKLCLDHTNTLGWAGGAGERAAERGRGARTPAGRLPRRGNKCKGHEMKVHLVCSGKRKKAASANEGEGQGRR